MPLEKFKEKCGDAHIQRCDFTKIIGNDHEAFAIVHIITRNNKIIRDILLSTTEK